MNPKQQEVFNLLGYLPLEERVQLGNSTQFQQAEKLHKVEARLDKVAFLSLVSYAAVCILTFKLSRPK